MKTWDYGVIFLAAALTVLSGVWVYAGSGVQPVVRIRGAGESWIFPLDAREIVRVAGPLGDTVVELRGGRARIASSPCANQICVAAGELHVRGQWAACLPNQVFVGIEGSGDVRGSGGQVDGAAW